LKIKKNKKKTIIPHKIDAVMKKDVVIERDKINRTLRDKLKNITQASGINKSKPHPRPTAGCCHLPNLMT